MSWSLELRNGDLTIGGARFGAVTGTQKLIQDLRCTLLERMGTDPSHPSFGSLLDGGRTPEGIEQPSLLGADDWDRITIQIESEIRRITSEHQARQVQRGQGDRITYGHSTLTKGEVLLALEGIEMIQVQDTLIAVVSLRVGSDDIHTLNIPLSSEPVITR